MMLTDHTERRRGLPPKNPKKRVTEVSNDIVVLGGLGLRIKRLDLRIWRLRSRVSTPPGSQLCDYEAKPALDRSVGSPSCQAPLPWNGAWRTSRRRTGCSEHSNGWLATTMRGGLSSTSIETQLRLPSARRRGAQRNANADRLQAKTGASSGRRSARARPRDGSRAWRGRSRCDPEAPRESDHECPWGCKRYSQGNVQPVSSSSFLPKFARFSSRCELLKRGKC